MCAVGGWQAVGRREGEECRLSSQNFSSSNNKRTLEEVVIDGQAVLLGDELQVWCIGVCVRLPFVHPSSNYSSPTPLILSHPPPIVPILL